MTTSPTTTTPPKTLVLAFVLLLISTAMSLVTLAGAATSDALADKPAERTFLMVVGGLFAALYLWLAFRVKAGKNWARVVITVMTVLEAASVFTMSDNGLNQYGLLGISAAAVLAAYSPDSNAYFASVRRAS
ncbi:hypothetical protein KCV87_00120 [Actinosynnema pretiosum subsp. pretiosum]|uniref:Uncharacterized protein n=2 Tax=Actinosynnema TaxID=40566 RepID=C6WFS7_ACTMD|nr:hypothetical protein [Actinosynnema mirum]ACU37863.1 hypothetical protein Amir_3999 [Actinosynnema mirum DSM 43827]AXX31345.1 hypothetical protein APASM_3980 [Actinosynnema pretiosum subsp. pretiosum]QUF04596.1 hypothetical protein KCV87_00120 [Actinosynnema pretiosum subsp. pretiosum]